MIKTIDQADLDRWVEALVAGTTVYGVQAKGDRFAFDKLARAGDLRLDYDVTILPPKKYLQPPREVLMTFDTQGHFESVMDATPFVLFGVHPYDMAAISQMDRVFSMGQADAHYLSRREAATIVVSDVQAASDAAFAGFMGYATTEGRDGFDVLVTRLEDGRYVVESRTAKGEAAAAPLAGTPDAGDAELEARRAQWKKNVQLLRGNELKARPEEIPALLDKAYDHPVWEEQAALCYSCGSCNLVCPTCYCFNVEEEFSWDMASGERTRRWDGCMLTNFATVAGDHNFRKQRAARYRHRYLRKGKYVADILGEMSCVGCGRCGAACTAGIANPTTIFNRLLEDQ